MRHSLPAIRPTSLALLAVLLLSACAAGSQTGTSDAPSGPSPSDTGGTPSTNVSSPSAPPPSADGGTSPSSAATDACALLSDADLTELTTWAADVVEPGPQQGIFQTGCLWTLSGGTSPGLYGPASISLGVVAPGGRSYYDTYFAPFVEDYGQEPVAGVGDVAWYDSLANTVIAVEGDTLVSLQWIDPGGDEAAGVALTDRILSNVAGD